MSKSILLAALCRPPDAFTGRLQLAFIPAWRDSSSISGRGATELDLTIRQSENSSPDQQKRIPCIRRSIQLGASTDKLESFICVVISLEPSSRRVPRSLGPDPSSRPVHSGLVARMDRVLVKARTNRRRWDAKHSLACNLPAACPTMAEYAACSCCPTTFATLGFMDGPAISEQLSTNYVDGRDSDKSYAYHAEGNEKDNCVVL